MNIRERLDGVNVRALQQTARVALEKQLLELVGAERLNAVLLQCEQVAAQGRFEIVFVLDAAEGDAHAQTIGDALITLLCSRHLAARRTGVARNKITVSWEDGE